MDTYPQSGILVEAEEFNDFGGWILDSQFKIEMGSPYLLQMPQLRSPSLMPVSTESGSARKTGFRAIIREGPLWQSTGKASLLNSAPMTRTGTGSLVVK